MVGKWTPKTVDATGPLDVVRDGRAYAICHSWDGVFARFHDLKPGVYEIQREDGTIVAVATVRVDRTWRLEGGKRYGR